MHLTHGAVRNRFAPLWIWLFIYPLALDFAGEKDANDIGHLIQILLALPALGGGIALVLIGPTFFGKSSFRTLIVSTLLLTVAGSLVPELVNRNDVGAYLRVLLPFMLFLIGYMAACRPWQTDRLEHFESAIFHAMLGSFIFSFVTGMMSGGSLEAVRFRILSPTAPALQAILLHEIVVAKKLTKTNLLLLFATIIVELLSVTRSQLLTTMLIFCYATWLSTVSLRHLFAAMFRALAIGTLTAAVVIVSCAWLFPSVIKHWEQRVTYAKSTVSGKDPTTITRLAEIKDQYDQVTSSTTSLLLGKGFGHEYGYSPDYLSALSGQISTEDFYAIREFTAGHNFWVYLLFAGGLLFGTGLPGGLLYALYRCSAAFRRWRRVAPDAPHLAVMGRALLVTVALPASTIGGNPLGPRFSGLVFGVALGLLVACYARLVPRLHARSAPRTMTLRRMPTLAPAGAMDARIEAKPESATATAQQDSDTPRPVLASVLSKR